jgi:hypothetical protein
MSAWRLPVRYDEPDANRQHADVWNVSGVDIEDGAQVRPLMPQNSGARAGLSDR